MAPGDACAGVALLEPHDVPPSPFNLTPEQGLQVSVAICTVWAVAWSIRQVAEVLRVGDRSAD